MKDFATQSRQIALKSFFVDDCRAARWFVFKPKIPIWVNFGGRLNGK
jgi:hypothetical protein